MAAVKQYGWALDSASEYMHRDREIVMDAVNKNEHALQLVSDNLKKYRYIVIDIVK